MSALTRCQSAPRPVTLPWGDQTRPMPCWLYPAVPGLSVTEWPADAWASLACFTVTHLASGARVGPHTYATRDAAERALTGVADLFCWTQPMDVLRAEYDLRTAIDPTLPDRMRDALAPEPDAERMPR